MRVGFDATTWTNPRGYGRFTREILRALAGHAPGLQVTAFTDPSVPPRDLPDGVDVVQVDTDVPPAVAAAHDSQRSIRDLWRMSRAMTRAEVDVLFFPTVYTYVPVATRRPVVVAIHDAIPERHPQLAFASRRARWLWTAKLAAARRQASSIVTVSETSKQNLVGHFGVPASRIAVVPEAPADCFVPRSADDQRRVRVRHGLTPDAPLVLHAGGLSPHKNLPCLVESLAMLRHRSPAPMLALAGGAANDVFHVDRGAIEQAASRAGVEAQVRFLGYVSDEDLAALYSAADVVAMVSLDEGFGLPAIEAMACGTPVVLSRAGSLPEVAGGAALLVDPHDTPAIAEALGSLIDDRALRASLARLGRERAAQFSWRASAERLAHVLQSVSDGAYG